VRKGEGGRERGREKGREREGGGRERESRTRERVLGGRERKGGKEWRIILCSVFDHCLSTLYICTSHPYLRCPLAGMLHGTMKC
jgi:hypothetical protein